MDIKNLIAECTAYDFKVALEEKKPKSWLKSVSAFANEYGGSLFFGVDNEGNVRGLEDIAHVTEAIRNAIKAYMDPLPDIEAIPLQEAEKKVLQLRVHPGRYTPYYVTFGGMRETFIRNCDESIVAVGEKLTALVLKGSNKTFDSLKTDMRAEDNTFVILANTYKERTEQEWNKKYLKSFGLVTDEGVLTNAGALFCDDCKVSQSRLYCTRWDGLEKTDAINDAEFKGNILMLLREAMNFVKSNTRKGWEKLPDGRKNKPEYAESATYREQVVTKQSLSSHQVVIKLSLSVPVVCNLLEKMVNPLSAKEMRAFCNLKDSSYFKTNVIDPLIEAGLIAMTHPDSPKSPKQKYYLSEYGRSLLENQPTSDAGSKVSRLLAELTDEERKMALEILKGDE